MRVILAVCAIVTLAPLVYLGLRSGPGTAEPRAASRTAVVAESASTSDSGFDPANPTAADPQERIDASIARGLDWLAQTQDKSTGAWVQDVGFKFNEGYEVSKPAVPHVGVTAMALMAYLAGGHLPSRGKYGDVVERGTDFVLSCVTDDTGFVTANETRMYSHAFATLFLAEIFGMTRRKDIHARLQQAVDLTVQSQNNQGSWRYRPYAPDSDMSIAVCQLMALRAARNIGIHVPKSTIDRAYQYIRQSAYGRGMNSGAFKYQIDQQMTRTSFALTAAGVASLMHSGFYDDPLIAPGIGWLKSRLRNLEDWERFPSFFYWYGQYYAAQVMFIAADQDDQKGLWKDFYWPMVSSDLLRNQSGDGSWRNNPGPGDVFGTAIACIVLQIPYQYLPIFQR